jgi:hypothetical protein
LVLLVSATPLVVAAEPILTRGQTGARIPQGTIKSFSFSQSHIFPGTRRGGSVFIPAQYDPAKPACVYVRQDG